MVVSTSTFSPVTMYCHQVTASMAACARSGGPERYWTSRALPSLLITAWRTTVPETLATCASCGSSGTTRYTSEFNRQLLFHPGATRVQRNLCLLLCTSLCGSSDPGPDGQNTTLSRSHERPSSNPAIGEPI